VLEIGFGWGALAIQLVRRIGCHYTGVTLSQEQLKFAQDRVKEAHMEVLTPLFFKPFFLPFFHKKLKQAT
jgi:cyclopropane-fatty-acyl-phospholipid synthase